MKRWLVAANSSIARVYKIEKQQSLVEVEQLEHPESRLHTRDLVTDKPGRDFESVGHARHAFESFPSPKQLEFSQFAKELSDYLSAARQRGEYDCLYIAASPTLLGLLRQSLDNETAKLVKGEIDKDMTHMNTNEIITHVPFIF
ncbi:MAG: host attachment protein [Parachlamydia sp.]|jgi:protein required for attachment to host cells|nr:host attachment protein [Parachlamydia sp.]